MRFLFLVAVGLCSIAATCTPTYSSGTAVAPAPAASADSVRNAAFALVTRMATRFGLAIEVWEAGGAVLLAIAGDAVCQSS
jgi:hypothetical protein